MVNIGKGNLIIAVYQKFKTSRQTLNYFVVFGISFLGSFVLLYILNYIENTLFTTTSGNGFLNDIAAAYGACVLGVPVLCTFTVYYIDKVPMMLERIKKSRAIVIDGDVYDDIVTKYHENSNRIWYSYAIPTVSLLVNLIWVFDNNRTGTGEWFFSKQADLLLGLSLPGIFYYFIMVLFYYVLGFLIVYFFSTVFFLRKLSKKMKLEVNPIHPDNCGGLSAIGEFGLLITTPIVILGIAIALVFVSDVRLHNMKWLSQTHIMVMAIYLISSLIASFLPLMSFREPMKKSKAETLEKLGDVYCQLYRDVMGDEKINLSDLSKLEKINIVSTAYDRAAAMPIWPFNFDQMARFLSRVFLPFLIMIVQPIIEYLVQYSVL